MLDCVVAYIKMLMDALGKVEAAAERFKRLGDERGITCREPLEIALDALD